jgi:hypothetical protein
MCGGPSVSERDDYRAEDDLRTLTRAEEIRSDVKRLAGVKRFHRKQTQTAKRLTRSLNGRSAR